MLLALRKDHWRAILQRYAQGTYQHIRKLNLDPQLCRPNILGCVEFQPQFTYDAIRLFPRHRVKRLTPLNGSQCPHCYQDDLRLNITQGSLVCFRCGTVVHERMTVSEMDIRGHDTSSLPLRLPRRHSDNLSKRVNHFKYWLLRLQGKETHRITSVHVDLLREVVASRPHLTIPLLKQLMRTVKLQRFYNNVYYLYHILTNHPLPEFSPEQEGQLLTMFRNIQRPFSDHRGRRVNMLSYLYIIRKFSELLGWEEFADTLDQQKSREKMRTQDRIWFHICHDLGYPFYPSV